MTDVFRASEGPESGRLGDRRPFLAKTTVAGSRVPANERSCSSIDRTA